MSAFLLPLRYLTLGREGAFDGYASSGYFADESSGSAVGASAMVMPGKNIPWKD
jgi:hypothetical protein